MIDEQFLQTIPQYGIGGFVGKIFKKVKDTVKKVAEPAGMAVGFMLGGPTGAAIGGGIGSLVAGKDSNRALRTAALGLGLGNLAGAGFFGGNIANLSAQGFMGIPGSGNMLSGQFLSPDLGSRFYSGIGNLIPGRGGQNFLFEQGAGNLSPTAVSNFANSYGISNAQALNILSGRPQSSLLSNSLQYGLPLLAGYSAYQAAQDNQEYIPADEARLNPFYYQNPEEFQVAGQGVKPVYYDTLQDYQGIPVNELPDDFFRAAQGGIVRRQDGSDPTGEIKMERITPTPNFNMDDLIDQMQKDQMMGYLEYLFSENPTTFRNQYGNELADYFMKKFQMGDDMMRKNLESGAIVDERGNVTGYNLAEGGVVQLANGSKKFFPRKNGAINGPGTGTSDDIPAMLSDGEFVFTAKAVRNAGGGDRREGAKRMYQTMKNLEKGGTLSPQSRGVN
tara:strand:- start:410 stop:1750 length:1341 start_codon:yes stop_codon:yes gene_type:complete